MKDRYEWIDEASNFVCELERSTGKKPTLSDVIAECKDIATDKEARDMMIDECGSVKEYAETLFSYMQEV